MTKGHKFEREQGIVYGRGGWREERKEKIYIIIIIISKKREKSVNGKD